MAAQRSFTTIIGYLAPTIVFVGAMIGLLGPSRVPNASGPAAITTFGWFSAGLAAISLAAALHSAYVRQQQLAAAQAEQARIRSVARAEIVDGIEHLENVLRYAALMPYTTTPVVDSNVPGEIPYSHVNGPGGAGSLDLQSDAVLNVLENFYFGPRARLKSPYVPHHVPFGTDVVRPSLTVIAEETAKARQTIETAVQKYAAHALNADGLEAASAVLRAPFLHHLISIRESWEKRSHMEDSDSPKTLNFRFLNSGVSGGYKEDYLKLLGDMSRLRQAVDLA